MSEPRKIIDCRLYPSETGCTLSIEGTEDEVLQAATHHAVTMHGHDNSPELRDQIRSMMQDVTSLRTAAK
jgi:Protein of unknown function (DUF1059)